MKKSCELISHRGPDNKGYFFQDDFSLGLGHTRLSIIDVSTNGNQPMISNCKNFILIFNGEIYNYNELKKDLNLEYQNKEKYSMEIKF